MIKRLYYADREDIRIREATVVEFGLQGVAIEIQGEEYDVYPCAELDCYFLEKDSPERIIGRLYEHPDDMKEFMLAAVGEALDQERQSFAEVIRQRVHVLDELEAYKNRWETECYQS